MSKKCPKCNTLNENHSRYCMNCGMELPQGNPDLNQQLNPQFNQQPPNDNKKTIKKIVVVAAIICILFFAYQYYAYDHAYHDYEPHFLLNESEDTWFSSYINETSDAYYINNMEIQVKDSIVENPIVYLTIYDSNASVLAQGEFIPPEDVKKVKYESGGSSGIWIASYTEPVKLTKTNNTGTPYTIVFDAINKYDESNTKSLTHKFNESEKERLSFMK